LEKPENNTYDTKYEKQAGFDLTPQNNADRLRVDHFILTKDIQSMIMDLHEGVESNWAEVSKRRIRARISRGRYYLNTLRTMNGLL